MTFPVSGHTMSPPFLVAVGFLIGILGGFFGVGGSFLAGPALFAAGLPMNYVVGTDLAHIVGKSIVAARRHRVLGNVDMKLGLIMVAGTMLGVESGAQLIELLKRRAHVDLVVGSTLFVVLLVIAAFTFWESWRTLRLRHHAPARHRDRSVLDPLARRVHAITLRPVVSLPVSGIARISIWPILAVAYVGGVFSGFLGGGAGYIRMPSLVYLLGVPTHVAVGTDLFEIVISASYGTLSHALKGNVDVLIALVMQTGAVVGAQIGALLTGRFSGPWIRMVFVPLPVLGAIILLYNLLSGAGGHHP